MVCLTEQLKKKEAETRTVFLPGTLQIRPHCTPPVGGAGTKCQANVQVQDGIYEPTLPQLKVLGPHLQD